MKIVIQTRCDTDGNRAPVIDHGKKYPYIGTRFNDAGIPIVTGWGETPEEVERIMRETRKLRRR